MRISFGSHSVEIKSLASFLRNNRGSPISDDSFGSLLKWDLGWCNWGFAFISESLTHERDILPGSLNFDFFAGNEVPLIEVILVHISLEDLTDHADIHSEEVCV